MRDEFLYDGDRQFAVFALRVFSQQCEDAANHSEDEGMVNLMAKQASDARRIADQIEDAGASAPEEPDEQTCTKCRETFDLNHNEDGPEIETWNGQWQCPCCGSWEDRMKRPRSCEKCGETHDVERDDMEMFLGKWICPDCGHHNATEDEQ